MCEFLALDVPGFIIDALCIGFVSLLLLNTLKFLNSMEYPHSSNPFKTGIFLNFDIFTSKKRQITYFIPADTEINRAGGGQILEMERYPLFFGTLSKK